MSEKSIRTKYNFLVEIVIHLVNVDMDHNFINIFVYFINNDIDDNLIIYNEWCFVFTRVYTAL